MGQVCEASARHDSFFYFALVEGGRWTLEAVVQRSLQTPAVSRFPETEVYAYPRGQ
jgi:hypothetical protein